MKKLIAVLLAFVVACGPMIPYTDTSGHDHSGHTSQALVIPTCVTLQQGTRGTVDSTEIRSTAPTTNYSAQTAISVISGQRDILLRFDTATVPASAVVVSADVSLTANLTALSGTLSVYPNLGAWTPASVTWATAPAFAGTADYTGTQVGGGVTTFPVSVAVAQGWVGAGPNYGIRLTKTPNAANWFSSLWSTAASRPSLRLCYTAWAMPAPLSLTPATVAYNGSLTMKVYAPPTPNGAAVGVFHGGGMVSTTASADDANVVSICQEAAAMGIACFAVNYTPASATAPVGVSFRNALCAARWIRDNAATYGATPARISLTGVSAGGTLAVWVGEVLRAGYSVPGMPAGLTMPGGFDLTDVACPALPAVGDATLVKAVPAWYPLLDFRSYGIVNNNGAAANHNLEIVCGANFGTTAYANCSGDLSPMALPRSAALGFSLVQGELSGFDGDGIVKWTTQALLFDSARAVKAPGESHNFSPLSTSAGAAPGNYNNFYLLSNQ